jgi:hypothetical protein
MFAQFPNINPGSIDIRGQESGSAANLATFILSDMHGRSGTKLLYLTGDKNRDTISMMLSGENITLEPLQVYRTQESSSFAGRLASVLETSLKGQCFLCLTPPSCLTTPRCHTLVDSLLCAINQFRNANTPELFPTAGSQQWRCRKIEKPPSYKNRCDRTNDTRISNRPPPSPR